MRCIGVYFIEKSNQTLNNIGQQNINKSFKNLSKITPESFKNHAKMTNNYKKRIPFDPLEGKLDSGIEFWSSKVPKWCDNGGPNETKIKQKS